MATATQAIERLAKVTGQYPASVALLARHLRGEMWPRSRQGGRGGAAHVNEFHLVNLSLGMLATNTLAQAVEQVARYRALSRMGNPLHPPGSMMLGSYSPADSIA